MAGQDGQRVEAAYAIDLDECPRIPICQPFSPGSEVGEDGGVDGANDVSRIEISDADDELAKVDVGSNDSPDGTALVAPSLDEQAERRMTPAIKPAVRRGSERMAREPGTMSGTSRPRRQTVEIQTIP
ncbi:MAG: hypothetical protein ACI91O_001310 [Candidatus Poriferisodalaceae bacterium]